MMADDAIVKMDSSLGLMATYHVVRAKTGLNLHLFAETQQQS